MRARPRGTEPALTVPTNNRSHPPLPTPFRRDQMKKTALAAVAVLALRRRPHDRIRRRRRRARGGRVRARRQPDHLQHRRGERLPLPRHLAVEDEAGAAGRHRLRQRPDLRRHLGVDDQLGQGRHGGLQPQPARPPPRPNDTTFTPVDREGRAGRVGPVRRHQGRHHQGHAVVRRRRAGLCLPGPEVPRDRPGRIRTPARSTARSRTACSPARSRSRRRRCSAFPRARAASTTT